MRFALVLLLHRLVVVGVGGGRGRFSFRFVVRFAVGIVVVVVVVGVVVVARFDDLWRRFERSLLAVGSRCTLRRRCGCCTRRCCSNVGIVFKAAIIDITRSPTNEKERERNIETNFPINQAVVELTSQALTK